MTSANAPESDEPARPKPGGLWARLPLGWIAISVLTLSVTIVFANHGGAGSGASVLAFWTMWMFQPLSTILHEFGHATAVQAMGHRVRVIEIGSGPVIWRTSVGAWPMKFRRKLMAGGRVHYATASRATWGKVFVIAAAGPATNLVLLALIVWADHALRGHAEGRWSVGVGTLVAGLALDQAWAVASTLFPHRSRFGDELSKMPSDGLQMLKAARGMAWGAVPSDLQWKLRDLPGRAYLALGWPAAAARHYERSAKAHPEVIGHYYALALHALGRAEGPKSVVKRYLEIRANQEPVPAEYARGFAFVWGNAAWQALRSGDATLLPMAEELAERALAVSPSAPALRATYGALLMAKGHTHAAEPMLASALVELTDRADRAEFDVYLASLPATRRIAA